MIDIFHNFIMCNCFAYNWLAFTMSPCHFLILQMIFFHLTGKNVIISSGWDDQNYEQRVKIK